MRIGRIIRYGFFPLLLAVAAYGSAQVQQGHGYWHQEWSIEQGDSIPMIHSLPVYVFSRPVDLRRDVGRPGKGQLHAEGELPQLTPPRPQ